MPDMPLMMRVIMGSNSEHGFYTDPETGDAVGGGLRLKKLNTSFVKNPNYVPPKDYHREIEYYYTAGQEEYKDLEDGVVIGHVIDYVDGAPQPKIDLLKGGTNKLPRQLEDPNYNKGDDGGPVFDRSRGRVFTSENTKNMKSDK
jgi:hypothetical protein